MQLTSVLNNIFSLYIATYRKSYNTYSPNCKTLC